MVITVTVPDEFAEEAEARGLTTERFVETIVLREQAALLSSQPEKTVEKRMVDLDLFLAEMSAFAHKIPVLPDEALTRESFYSDHD